MRRKTILHLDFEIDKLTNSIENSLTGEIFETAILELSNKDVSTIKKAEWQFNLRSELRNSEHTVYKLTTIHNPTIIHGLISLSDKRDHIFIHLLESASINKGRNKLYTGVAGNLVAFASKCSFERGYQGIVAFVAKSNLIEHYKTSLGAKRFSGNGMFIDTRDSYRLVRQYFKNFDNG